MTKRKDIIKTVKAEAKIRGMSFDYSQRGNHEILRVDGLVIPLPRHREIRENTTRRIYKELEAKFGKDWWR